MFTVTLAGLWARKRRLIGTCTRRRARRRLPRRHARARRHHARRLPPGVHRRQRRHRRRRPQRRRDGLRRGARPRPDRRRRRRRGRRRRPACAPPSPSVDGVATIVGADGDRIGGDGPPTTGTNWIDDPDLNPYRLAEGRAPAAPDEVVIDRGAAEDGDLAVGDRTTVLTPTPVEVTVVGIATFGDVDSLGPTTYTAFTLPEADASCSPTAPTRISAVLVGRRGRRQPGDAARRDHRSCCRPASRR